MGNNRSRTIPLLALLTAGLIPGARAAAIDAVYAFGDSTSDVGNVYAAVGIPQPPYVNGQFSNGPVFPQALASLLGVGPLKPSLLGGTDFAYGSAQSGTTAYNTASQVDLTGPLGQIAQFQLAHPAGADPNALYTIWIGSNDLGSIPAGATSSQVAADTAQIIGNIDSAINTLAGLNARNFLIVTVPDLGKTPAVLAAGPAASAGASALAAAFDNALVNGSGPIPSLSTLAAADGVHISVLNAYSLLDAFVANPSAYGFTNVTSPCYTGDYKGFADGGTVCATPSQYLFFDSTHPSAAAYALGAQAAFALVTPEPASVTLLSGGLLALALLRRRK